MNEELQAILAADLGSLTDAGTLAETLYARCYARSIGEVVPSPETDEDLTPALMAANQSRAGWDFGWRADQALDDGRILARKAGAARAFRPGQYITLRGPGSKVEEGDAIQVFCAAGADLQAGFYYAFGETAPEFDEFDDVLRFYWNVPAEAAARLMELVTGEFNRWQTPFRFKCGRNSAVCGRRDAAVLYVQRPYYPMAARLVERIHAEIGAQLRDGVPLFTLRLARGLGFAEEPGESFGQHRSFGQDRCAILAEAMLAARTVEQVRRQFESRGLSLEKSWLNARLNPNLNAGQAAPMHTPFAGRGQGSGGHDRTKPWPRGGWIEAAERIGARLCRDALWSGGRCNWTADRTSENGKAHGALGPRLYSGSSGIALFLWRLAQVTGEPIFRQTAEGALAQALSRLPVGGCGFYTGELGIQYAAGEIRGKADFSRLGPDPANLDVMNLDVMNLDVIDGSAGAIPVLLQYGLTEHAVRHGDLLVREAERVTLTGFSHGKAGVGWALLELFGATGEARFRAAALEAFSYERRNFDPVRRSWPDYREGAPAETPAAWCHGAGGIAFSRLRSWQILRDEEILAEARTALGIVRDELSDLSNFSLCHGVAGNADLLLYASEVLGEPEWQEAAERAGAEGLEQYQQRRVPWPSGLLVSAETPDLMWGLAGVGYFYLRLAEPRRIPTVLLPGCRCGS